MVPALPMNRDVGSWNYPQTPLLGQDKVSGLAASTLDLAPGAVV